MATTGTYTDTFANDDLISEAFERINKDADAIGQRHITTALRSLSFMLMEWETKGVSQYRIETFTFDSAAGFTTNATSLTLDGRVIRVLHVVHRDGSTSTDTRLLQIGRIDYDSLAKKDQTGNRPDRYYVDRERSAPVMYLWPAIDNANDTLYVYALTQHQDVGTLADDPDIERVWIPAAAAGLTAKLAEKYEPALFRDKLAIAKELFLEAKGEDREAGPTRFKMRGFGGRRRR